MRRLGRALLSVNHAGLAGAFVAIAASMAGPDRSFVGAFVGGWLLGVATLGLIRLFSVSPWAYPVVGLVAGPIPIALLVGLFGKDGASDEWGGAWVLSALFGAVVGVLEWARVRQLERESGRPGAE